MSHEKGIEAAAWAYAGIRDPEFAMLVTEYDRSRADTIISAYLAEAGPIRVNEYDALQLINMVIVTPWPVSKDRLDELQMVAMNAGRVPDGCRPMRLAESALALPAAQPTRTWPTDVMRVVRRLEMLLTGPTYMRDLTITHDEARKLTDVFLSRPCAAQPTSEGEEREAFEAWALTTIGRVWRSNEPGESNEGYQDSHTNVAWRAWQARSAREGGKR